MKSIYSIIWIIENLCFKKSSSSCTVLSNLESLKNQTPIMTKSPQAYWRKNLTYLSILLLIWFIVSFVCGILLVDQLNTIKIAGFPLGFWFAQQGSIYVFVILIFVYMFLMNKLDKSFDVDEK